MQKATQTADSDNLMEIEREGKTFKIGRWYSKETYKIIWQQKLDSVA